ncbi:MAG: hypothetical protein IPO40_08425 [Fibrobacteres bacterium]|nr:hypothetical protein [Fibrobacterota bacterium]
MKMPSCVSALKMLAILSVFASSAMAQEIFAKGRVKSIEVKEGGIILTELILDPAVAYAKPVCPVEYKDGTVPRFAFSESLPANKALLANLMLAYVTQANVTLSVSSTPVSPTTTPCDVWRDSHTAFSVLVD